MPASVAAMLEKKRGLFNGEQHDLSIDSSGASAETPESPVGKILDLINHRFTALA